MDEPLTYATIQRFWQIRRDEIKAKYAETNPDGSRKYSQRDIAKMYNISDTRVYLILHDNKPANKRKARGVRS